MKPYYERNGITIYHGDCRDVLPCLELGSVGMLLTDPPYAVSVAGSQHIGQPGKGRRNLDFFRGDDDWARMTEIAVEAVRLALPSLAAEASIYAWVGHRQFGPLVAALELAGYSTRFLVWEKSCPVPPAPGSGWPSGAELCVYGYRPGRTWNHRGADTPRSNVLRADGYRHGQPGKVDHPTQKPPEVVSPLIRASSRPGGVILDTFLGSGTTAVVARALGRRCIGIEIEERYCEIAALRLQQDVLPLFDVAEVPA
jgi:site-specific DNA-methyltransferase (adenine-specific)